MSPLLFFLYLFAEETLSSNLLFKVRDESALGWGIQPSL